MPATYDKIATYTIPSATLSYTFSTIPDTYTDLILISIAQKTTSGSGSGFNLRFNGDSGTNYSNTFLEGSGSSASSYRSSNSTGLNGGAVTSSAIANQFDININQILNYSNSTTYKTVLGRYNDNEFSYVGASSSLWRNTNAITSLTVVSVNNFAIGSTFTLYGIKAA
jgi:hypothetical protein